MHDREHVICVALTNEDWKAFLQLQPEPVSWLKGQILERIAAERRAAPAASTAATAQAQVSSAV